MRNNTSIVVFDLCGTLFHSNTTFDYIKQYHKNRKNWLRYFKCLVYTSYFGKILNRIFRFSIRKRCIQTLADESRSDLENFSEVFYDTFLLNRKNHTAFDQYFIELSDSNKILICSASLSEVVKVVARRLDVSYVSSELRFDKNGKCFGELSKDLKGNKSEIFSSYSIRFFATDNLDDVQACRLSEKCVIFSQKKNIEYWRRSLHGKDYEIFEI